MIASELALDLKIEPGVLSKRLKLYFGEVGEKKPQILSELTLQHMYEVDHLIKNNQAANTRAAVQMVLGKFTEAAPPASVQRIESLLLQLLEGQNALHLKLDQLLTVKVDQRLVFGPSPVSSVDSTAELKQIFASVASEQ